MTNILYSFKDSLFFRAIQHLVLKIFTLCNFSLSYRLNNLIISLEGKKCFTNVLSHLFD